MNKKTYERIEDEIVMDLIQQTSSIKSLLDREKEEGLDAQKNMLLSMVDIAEDFERLLNIIEPKMEDADPKTKKWVESFRSIHKGILRKLEKFRVKKMNIIVGDEAHPVYHKIIVADETEEYSNNAIISCKSNGYLWGTDVLREAEVVVAKNANSQAVN